MKNVLIVAAAVVALIVCLLIARWADGRTQVPSSTPSDSPSASTAAQPDPSGVATAPGDIENGLGWG